MENLLGLSVTSLLMQSLYWKSITLHGANIFLTLTSFGSSVSDCVLFSRRRQIKCYALLKALELL